MDQNLKHIISDEIPSLIEKASLFGGRVVQLNPEIRLESEIKSVKFCQSGTITMELAENIPFEEDRPLSISFSYRNLSYYLTSGQFSIQGNILTTGRPMEARALQVREHERYVLPLDQKIMTSIYRIERRGSVCDLDAQIVDVSENGMGIILHNTNEQAIISNDHIWIKTIHHVTLEQPIFGKVVFVMHRRYKNGVIDIRVGISLETAIPGLVFSELKDLCRLVLV